ncbi:P-loop containing nucleoside triphosphate hydrolase protein, partial [Blyttiomyces helicus]
PWREAGASILSKACFNWVNQIITLGSQRPLEASDLLALAEPDTAAHIVALHHERRKRAPKASFLWNLMQGCWSHVLQQMLYCLGYTLLALSSPYFLNALTKWVEEPERELAVGSVLLAGLFTALCLRAVFDAQLHYAGRRSSLAVRAISVDEVYRKTLRRCAGIKKNGDGSPDTTDDASIGKIVTLMSTDVERVREYVSYCHRTLLEIPLSVILSLAGLFATVGWAAFAGLAIIILLIPAGTFFGKLMGDMEDDLMETTDKRVNAVNEMLQGIRIIKYFAWESKFIKRINSARSAEIVNWIRLSKCYIYYNLLTSGSSLIIAFATFAAYTLVFGHSLDASTAFTAISLLAILNRSVDRLPWAMGQFFQVKVSLERLGRFLAEPELGRFEEKTTAHDQIVGIAPTVGFRAGSFKYYSTDTAPKSDATSDGESSGDSIVSDFHLLDVDVEFPVGKLSLVAGATGSGKTSLILALLGEMKRVNGQQYLPTSHATAYVAQTAWLTNATIRDNILFGTPYDAKRYQETIEACALIRDLETLEGGDLTEIGEKGVNLSGGQKARISLARAAYSYAPLLLLDDPLSAVDAPTAKHLLHHCLLGVMKNRTVVLVSHAVGLVLPHADFGLVLKSGRVAAQGTPDELVRNPAADGVFGLELFASDREELTATETAAAAPQGTGTKLVDEEEKAIGSVHWTVYWTYFKAAGGLVFLGVMIFTFFLTNSFTLLDNLWIQNWTDKVRCAAPELLSALPAALTVQSTDASPDESAPIVERADVIFFLGVYGILAVAVILASTVQFAFLIFSYIKAGTAMHNNLLVSILGAPMRFFEVTPIGRILNRFSKDTDSVDNNVMYTVEMFVTQIFKISFILGLIAFKAPVFIVGVIPLFYIFWLVANIYLLPSRDLTRLESISRSPLFSQFSETLSGVETVRAYAAENRLLSAVHEKIDMNHRAYFLMWAANRWLNLRTDILGALVTLGAGLIILSGTLTAGMTGIILVYAFDFSDALLWIVRYYADMEMAMNSVERVAEYTATEQEPPAVIEGSRPPAEWPSKGAIHVKDLAIRYAPDQPAVLKKVTFSVNPGEKIGIVGRTGAGKSTLSLAFFRIIPLAGGSITIDGIDIDTIGLRDLRSNLTIIPQDPVLFSGTLRSNLDPFEEHTDEALWAALESVHVLDSLRAQRTTGTSVESGSDDNLVPETSAAVTLDASVSDNGENFSQGQRQLLCMARALLRRSKVIVLDEATASVDHETDAKIQETIRSQFSDGTVLCIAHRLRLVF